MRQAARKVASAAALAQQHSLATSAHCVHIGLASRTAGNAADLASIKWRANLEPPMSAAMAACSPSCGQRSFSTAAVARKGTHKDGNQGSSTKAALFFVLPCAFTAFLGTWQLQRRQWKANLIQNRDKALQAEGLELNELPPNPKEFARVHVQGHFDHANALFVGPRPRSSMGSATNGYQLITPVHSEQWKKTILVNRGWVPATWRSDPEIRQPWDTNAEIELEAVIRESESPSSFVPDNVPATGEWFWIEVPKMASALGLPADTPLVEAVSIDASPAGKGNTPSQMDILALRTARPAQPKETLPITRNVSELKGFKVTPEDHRNYALTWYTLSAATGAMAYGIIKRRKPAL